MKPKITIEEFLKIKQELIDFLEQKEEEIDELEFEENEETIKKIIIQYGILFDKLLQYDLGDIPFEKWDGITIWGSQGVYIPNFSNTHANIDFKIVEFEGNFANFRTCNIRNIFKHNLNDLMFDEEVVLNSPELFPYANYSPYFKEIYYGVSKLSLDDILDLSDEELDCLDKSTSKRFSKEYARIINIIGFRKTVELYKENQIDFINYVNIYDNICLNDYGFFDDNEMINNFYGYINKSLYENLCSILRNDFQYTEKLEKFVSKNFSIFLKIFSVPNIKSSLYLVQSVYSKFISSLKEEKINEEIEVYYEKFLKILLSISAGKSSELVDFLNNNTTYNIREKMVNSDEFITYRSSDILLDTNQSIIFEIFNPEFFTKFAQETNIFNGNFTNDVEQFIEYFKQNDYQIPKTYEEFYQFMTQMLLKTSIIYYYPGSKLEETNPGMFLPKDCPNELKEKFYNRLLTIEDIRKNKEYFAKTKVAYGLESKYYWVNEIQDKIDFNLFLKIISKYSLITENKLGNLYVNFIKNNIQNLNEEKLEVISEVLLRLENSNSLELRNFMLAIASQILELDNPLQKLEEIENIFLKNNLPTIGKTFSVFQILHPDFLGFSFEGSQLSPILIQNNNRMRSTIVFADLIKCAVGSNNKSIKDYLDNIEQGNLIYESIKNGQRKFADLTSEEIKILKTFMFHLITLYNSSDLEKMEELPLTDDLMKNLDILYALFKPNYRYDLPDRIVRMFASFAGFKSFEQLKSYYTETINEANRRNIAYKDFTLKQGDLVKGIGDITYLRSILQNGSVSKEYLGAYADSDFTPLDTDVSYILDEFPSYMDTIKKTQSAFYGPIFFVLKNRENRFNVTRRGEKYIGPISESSDPKQMELFMTLREDHYGIRTGFASSEIDYIISENNDPRIGLEIALNGFYIPVVNAYTKEVMFTYEDYKTLRSKMAGLKYYTDAEYVFDSSIEEEAAKLTDAEKEKISKLNEMNIRQSNVKHNAIYAVIFEAIKEIGLKDLKMDTISDLTPGTAEIIDTGSTGRGTNVYGDGDFDFMLKLDYSFMEDNVKMQQLREAILKRMPYQKFKDISKNIKIKGVKIEGLDELVDIDITFATRTDKIAYSTEECVKDRLKSLKEQDIIKYNIVVNNIIMAKKYLKEHGIYSKADDKGLGGVGVENWILQNGGSFTKAAETFLETAAKCRDFEEFCFKYPIWDFGENHISDYPHDNFVRNMNADSYKKMCSVLKEYLKSLGKDIDEDKVKSVELDVIDGPKLA